MKTVDIRGTAEERTMRLEAVEDLRGYDHCFISEAGVSKFAKTFGVVLKPYRVFANPEDPKGLTLNNGAKSAVGMGAHSLAMCVCSQLGVAFEDKYGRGSQLRACCDALEKHFSTSVDDDPLVRFVRRRKARGLKSGF